MFGVEDHRDGLFGGEDRGMRRPAPKVPAPETLEIGELGCPVMTPSCSARFTEQVEMMTYEPDDAWRDEPVEEIGADLVMGRSVDCFTHVVKEGRGPEFPIVRFAMRELEDLEGMKERVALWMIARRLQHAIERQEEVE